MKKTKKKKKSNKNRGNILSALFGTILCISVLYICINAAGQDSSPATEPSEPATVATTAPTEVLTEPLTEAVTEAVTEATEPVTEATEPVTEPATEPVTEPSQAATEAASEEQTYLLNTSSKKFHEPDCSRGPTKESNKQYFTGTRDDVIQQGYTPCKICNP